MANLQVSTTRGKTAKGGKTKANGSSGAEKLLGAIARGEPIFLASYANERSEARTYPPRDSVITNPDDVAGFIEQYDVPGRAVYFAINTMQGDVRRKEHVARVNALYLDLDFKGIVEDRRKIEAVIRKLKLKPSAVVASGHGLHVYWILSTPLGPENAPSCEALMRRMCGPLAGDTSAAEVVRVLRLPGSHNSKNGEWLDVQLVESLSSWKTYSYSEIDNFFEVIHAPLLTYKPTARDTKNNVIQFNAYQQFARDNRLLSRKFNADQLLDAMVLHDTQGHGIDDTYTKIIGAMVAEKASVDDCLRVLLRPTRLVYERDRAPGESAWNEKTAIREIKAKYRYFKRKDEEKPKPEPMPEPAPPKAQDKTGAKKTKMNGKTDSIECDFDPPERPVFTVSGGEHSNLVTAAEKALIDAGEELYVQTSGAVVRPIFSEVDAAHGRMTKVAELKAAKPEWIRDRLMKVADWQRWNARQKEYMPTDCPLDIAITLLAREGDHNFPKLAGIITAQTMRHDGSLLTSEGYDKRTRLLLVAPPKLPEMPAEPSKADADAALKLIRTLLREFPFTDDVAESVAVSGIVTAVCRGAFANAPLHIARASTPGSGKSFLWDIVSAIVSGFPMPVIAAGRTEEETEKRLGAALMAARPLISIDNLNGELSGDALCQIIERPIVDVRILGQSKMTRIEARGTTMFATGNNLVVVGDLCRRVLIASLDSKLERPELRTFKAEPVKKVLADRGKYIAAALTICRAYMVAGRPDKAKPLASFGDWSDCVRSALMWLGMADPVASMEIARSEDPERAKHRDIMLAWHAVYGSKAVTLATVIKDAVKPANHFTDSPEHPELHDAVDAVAGWRGPPDVLKLGNWLRKKKDRVIEGLKLMQSPNPKGGSLWWVETVK